MIYSAKSDEDKLEAIKGIESLHEGFFEVRMMNHSESTKLYHYTWYLMQIIGGKYKYTATEFQMIMSQKLEYFDKHFIYNIEKDDGTVVEVRKNIWDLGDDELRDICNAMIDFGYTKCGRLELPTFEAYKEKYTDNTNMSELIDYTIAKFR